MVFTNDNFSDVLQSCVEVKQLISQVQRKINYNVIAFHILKQSNTGQDGASEAIFDWHVDKQNDLTNAFLTVIINLRDTTTSMQIAGCKEYYYDGIGSAVVFYSRLWHKTGIAPPGTIKVALFCGNDSLKPFPKIFVDNRYPDCLCINTHNVFQFAHIHRNSIQIKKMIKNCLAGFNM